VAPDVRFGLQYYRCGSSASSEPTMGLLSDRARGSCGSTLTPESDHSIQTNSVPR
jgi:hypothetical protein